MNFLDTNRPLDLFPSVLSFWAPFLPSFFPSFFPPFLCPFLPFLAATALELAAASCSVALAAAEELAEGVESEVELAPGTTALPLPKLDLLPVFALPALLLPVFALPALLLLLPPLLLLLPPLLLLLPPLLLLLLPPLLLLLPPLLLP